MGVGRAGPHQPESVPPPLARKQGRLVDSQAQPQVRPSDIFVGMGMDKARLRW